MRIRVLSDLHLECYEQLPVLPEEEAELVVLAGDIHSAAEGIEWAAEQFPTTPVIYVPGNHEYYGGCLAERRQQLADTAQRHGIYLLDNRSVVLDGVRFLGTTLWADFALYAESDGLSAEATMMLASRRVPDFSTIRIAEERRFTPDDVLALHRQAVVWLEQELARDFDGPTVVISHHAPLAESIPSQFRGDSLSPAFASNLEPLMGRAALWVHGHVHEPVDRVCRGTRVLANPGGYPGEFMPPLFDAGKVVTV